MSFNDLHLIGFKRVLECSRKKLLSKYVQKCAKIDLHLSSEGLTLKVRAKLTVEEG
jgi:hypothetical protein